MSFAQTTRTAPAICIGSRIEIGIEMQRFEAVFQRERVTSVTRALADRGFNGISVKPARSSEGFFGLAAVAVEYDDAGECDSDAVKLELTVDDQLSLEVFRVIARTAGAGKISRFPMA